MADNYLFQEGGPGLAHLDAIAAKARCVVHGVGLSIASPEAPTDSYVRALGALCDRVRAHVVSDHLCFTHAGGLQSYDLLPFPHTGALLRRLVPRVLRLQETLGRRFAFENVSSYVSFPESEMSEIEFLGELCHRTGCGILLDVNNVFVSCMNRAPAGTEVWRAVAMARSELAKVDPAHVMQYHVAGHTERDGFLHDTHDAPVRKDVWDLCSFAVTRLGFKPFILECDDEAVEAETLEFALKEGFARMGLSPSAHSFPTVSSFVHSPNSVWPPAWSDASASCASSASSDCLAWQHDFLACLQSPLPVKDSLAAHPELALRLEPTTAERLDVYRLGYYSRVTATLADTLFEKASALVSADSIRGVLGRFRERFPATQPRLTACCDEVPLFAQTLPDVAEVPWLPDFLQLCLERWRVLTGADPVPLKEGGRQVFQPHEAFLQRNAAFLVSQHPLFSLWRLAERTLASATLGVHGHDATLDTPKGSLEGVEPVSEAVLLFKSGTTDLEMVSVDVPFRPFVSDLLAGKTILQAIDGMEARGDDVCAETFGKLLAALARRNAWTLAP
jgi:uncharacterized protein (UPF0276 family)